MGLAAVRPTRNRNGAVTASSTFSSAATWARSGPDAGTSRRNVILPPSSCTPGARRCGWPKTRVRSATSAATSRVSSTWLTRVTATGVPQSGAGASGDQVPQPTEVYQESGLVFDVARRA
ncbi:hypothetical protein GCM10022267_56370 [Lentzea roselyniae]|uniref:Uncharacterized protein n=1 Tax=Lentzea roselyniae TaxID=531940 RepID=A0ABP7BJS8_9PSEU